MPIKVKTGLPGGRALYRGKDAYAAQNAEQDARQQKTSSLAAIHLVGNMTLSTTPTAVVWGSYLSPSLNTPFLRGFSLLTDGASLACTVAGSYRIEYAMRASGVQAGDTLRGALMVVTPGRNTISISGGSANTDAVTPGQFNVVSLPVVLDLLAGSQIYLTAFVANTSANLLGLTVAGNVETTNMTGLTIEQIDL